MICIHCNASHDRLIMPGETCLFCGRSPQDEIRKPILGKMEIPPDETKRPSGLGSLLDQEYLRLHLRYKWRRDEHGY